MNQLSGQRNGVLDAAKGIGILLVVFAHINFIEPWQTIIYGFHMPLFYIISGMLFRREKYPSFGAFFKRRFRTLILPYLLFAFISLAYTSVLFLLRSVQSADEDVSSLFSYFIQIFIAQQSGKVCNAPLWFVPNLFLIECIYYFLSGIRSKPLHWLIILVLVAVGWFTESAYCRVDFSVLPWNFSSALFSLGFYAIGNHFARILLDPIPPLNGRSPILYRLLVFALCFAIEVPLALYNGHVTVGSRVLNNGFVFYATGILGSLGILSLAALLQKNRFFTFCGRTSFYIMATHKLFISILFTIMKILFSYPMKESHYIWGESLIVYVIVTALCVAFSYFYLKLKERSKAKRQARPAGA